MRAKFNVLSVTEFGGGHQTVKLRAVYEDGHPENNQFAEATPDGEISLTVDRNATGKGYLQPGKSYYVDFTEVYE